MNTTERIHALLEDRSFPSMVLLDGHWGVGKTYYVKNELQPYLKNYYPSPYKTIYLSLYGVTSLEDFKDRVLSLTYTENKKSSWLTKQGSDLIGSSAQAISGARGVGAALGGVASIVKYHYFNRIDNLVLLLDDLERITCEKVRTQVIGECLNLAENKQHIKIVVIGNQDKIGTHADIEKALYPPHEP
ncbi:NTPase, partial [Vibrio splendidus]